MNSALQKSSLKALASRSLWYKGGLFLVGAETLHASALARVFEFRMRRAEERGNTSTFSCRHASPGLEEQRRKAGGLRRQEIKHKMKTSSGLKRSRLAFLNFPTRREKIKPEKRTGRKRGQVTAAQSITHSSSLGLFGGFFFQVCTY